MGQVLYFIVSISDHCLLNLKIRKYSKNTLHLGSVNTLWYGIVCVENLADFLADSVR